MKQLNNQDIAIYKAINSVNLAVCKVYCPIYKNLYI